MGADGAPLAQRIAVLFLLFAPAFVWAFLAGVWVLRTLADAAGLARR